jgi:hypothetical protein
LGEANIQIASGTYAIVQLPPIQIGSFPQLTGAAHNPSDTDGKSQRSSKAHEIPDESDREATAT